MKTFVTSDIHGGLRALIQVLERANFNFHEDKLIVMGDVCDGWKEVYECVNYLSELPNLVYILGNHDDWGIRWLNGQLKKSSPGLHIGEYRGWYEQGGKATVESLNTQEKQEFVHEFLSKAKAYHLEGKKLFVHGGIDCESFVEDQDVQSIIWNRKMVQNARMESMNMDSVVKNYDEVFCGHTPTIFFSGITTPIHWSNVWLIDTGASYNGCLTLMDIDSHVFWQSDPVYELYPGEKAR